MLFGNQTHADEDLAQEFYDIWCDALEEVANSYGLTNVQGVRTVYNSAHERNNTTQTMGGEVERILWQEAHDNV